MEVSVSRKTYPSVGVKNQAPKSKTSRGSVFSVFRPVAEESAEELYELTKLLKADSILPEEALIKDPRNMHVTYLERSRLTRELQGFAQGFNAHEAINRINNECEESRQKSIVVQLGRASLMDRRDDTLVVRLDHSQIIADEYSLATSALRTLHLKIRNQFKPHISLARIPGVSIENKLYIAKQFQDVIPEEVLLNPLVVEPLTQRDKRQVSG